MSSEQQAPVPSASVSEEDELRSQLRSAWQDLKRREPLDKTYKHLLTNGVVTPRKPLLLHDKLYKAVPGNLRETVTAYMEVPTAAFDRIAQRQPLDETAMRAAFTLREGKKHEQQPLLNATLVARSRPGDEARKRRLEEIAMGLQGIKKKKQSPSALTKPSPEDTEAQQELEKARFAEMERDRLLQQRMQEVARRRQEEEDRRAREDEITRKRMMESPKLALREIYKPIFQTLWDMEFSNLGGTNPFRIVIDRDNCAAMGAADYFDVIEKPMNLKFIGEKVEKASYGTLEEFFADVNLLLQNALLYNSDPNNDYHIAAKEMQRNFMKHAKRVVAELKGNKR
jgi:hypothetical protein